LRKREEEAVNLSVLVIGDDKESLERIGGALAGMGNSYQAAENAEKALQSAKSDGYDLAIVDLSGPSADGIDLVKRLREAPHLCGIIVVADRKTKKRAMEELGSAVWAYLDRPLEPRELEVDLEHLMGDSCLRRDVSEKARKLSHLEVINEVIRESLLSKSDDDLLWYLARLVHERFNFFNVNVFLVDEKAGRVVLKAFAGGFGEDFVAGYSLPLGEGVVGWAARNRQTLLIGDVRKDPRRIQGFAFEENILSELAVPVVFESKVLGVIHTESSELDAFSPDDVMALETIADQVALSFEKGRLSRELIESKQLGEAINDSLPVSIVTVDRGLHIEWANHPFVEMRGMKREQLIGQPVTQFFPPDLVSKIMIEQDLMNVLETGNPITHSNIRYTSLEHPERVITISFSRILAGDAPRLMILIQDVTDFTKKAYQLSLLREITIAMQGVLERDKLLHLILTCVTAGFAIGFNRAFLFLEDRSQTRLKGIMGVGPVSHEEAYRIWNDLSRNALTFDAYLKNVNLGLISRSGLQDLVESVSIDLEKEHNILTETAKNGAVIHVTNAWDHPLMDDTMRKLVISNEFVTIPLIVKNETIGVVLADNAFSGRPINDESIEMLTMFSAQAAIAIENAQILGQLEEKVEELEEAYRNLEKAQDMIIRNEKLAAIGEVSARLAHEIRNPLATIGGFATLIQKKYDDKDRTIRNANIIAEEVHRLEHILSNVLDFTKTGDPKKTSGDINALVHKTLSVMEGNIVSNGVVVVLDLAGEPLVIDFDESQIKQVLINLIQNAINAMPEGGALEIKTSSDGREARIQIHDTGVGIPPQHLENIFEPFFTTRGNGTGLGLSISNRIVQNHGGRLEISSKEKGGTMVTIVLPAG
jgi:PAS domain S-box-containing protein